MCQYTGPSWLRTLIALTVPLLASPVLGASINYGNFGPVLPGIHFINVTESSTSDAVPLFWSPQALPVGLDFDPIGFVAYGGSGNLDQTKGELKFTLTNTTPLMAISEIGVFESGDYTMFGTGTGATFVSAALRIEASVTSINGIAVTPIVLNSTNESTSSSFAGNVVVQPWSLQGVLDVDAQMLGLGYSSFDIATSIDITITNTLNAASEAGSVASIAKKDLFVGTAVIIFIPEPASLAVFAVAGAILLSRRRD